MGTTSARSHALGESGVDVLAVDTSADIAWSAAAERAPAIVSVSIRSLGRSGGLRVGEIQMPV